MKKSFIIRCAAWIVRVFLVMISLVLVTMVIMLVHWNFDREFYEHLYLVNDFQAGLNSFNLKLSYEELTNISMADLSRGTMYWLILRSSIIAIIYIYGLKNMLNIIRSIRNFKTFYTGNIQSFKQLAWLGLFSAFIAFFNFGTQESEVIWNFTIPFNSLFVASVCLLLSEVFKEGQRLQNDSESIV